MLEILIFEDIFREYAKELHKLKKLKLADNGVEICTTYIIVAKCIGIRVIAPLLKTINFVEKLNLSNNLISDVSPLASMVGLKELNLQNNRMLNYLFLVQCNMFSEQISMDWKIF